MEFFDHHPLIEATVTGVIAGVLVSILPGPINISVIHEGASRGFLRALMIGLGAVAMETVYCAVGFASISSLFQSRMMHAAIELISFILVLFLGLKYLIAPKLAKTSQSADKIEHRLHPHTAFMIGFVRVLGNPSVLFVWITLSATFTAHGWVDPDWTSKSLCIGGVTVGAALWFAVLSYSVSLGHQKLSDRVLLRLSHLCGALLLVMALIIGVRLVRVLANPERTPMNTQAR
ncbi:hypothetical protein LBMAG56_27720 [Verrucomicrobiota bacterium]|nr:hypothetical protein LBMAG56_27720 [Verrucomicrobiota bacterium]